MNKTERDKWVGEVIHHVLIALAEDEALSKCLIFKGARILNLHLKDSRESLDLDSNFDTDFVAAHPHRPDQKQFLEEHIVGALRKYYEGMNPVRFTLQKASVEPSPEKDHPLGWNAFQIFLSIQDGLKADVRGLPALEIDVSAPESLGPNAVEEKRYDGASIRIYSLHRIAGEKLRAFLSTLPAYRKKVDKPGSDIRVKDLHDLTRILRVRPISDTAFWKSAGAEFRLACQSRCVDCKNLATFQEDWARTRQLYETDTNLARLIPWIEIEKSLQTIVQFLEEEIIVPIDNPLPIKAAN